MDTLYSMEVRTHEKVEQLRKEGMSNQDFRNAKRDHKTGISVFQRLFSRQPAQQASGEKDMYSPLSARVGDQTRRA